MKRQWEMKEKKQIIILPIKEETLKKTVDTRVKVKIVPECRQRE